MTFNPYGTSTPYLNGTGVSRDGARGQASDNAYDATREHADDNMERIRDLILGDLRRNWDARLHTLETRLQMLEDKVDALRHEHHATREEQLSVLADGIHQLGQRVRTLSRS